MEFKYRFIALAVLLLGCSEASPGSAIPKQGGSLRVQVRHPAPDRPAPVGGYDYVMGSIGNGDASLWIDGTPVPVLPNGSFLARVPAPKSGSAGYHIVAVHELDTIRVVHPVAAFPVGYGVASRLAVDSASVRPRGRVAFDADDLVEVALDAPRAAVVEVELASGAAVRLMPFGGARGTWAGRVSARLLAGKSDLVVSRGRDTIRIELPEVDTSGSIRGRGVIVPAEDASYGPTATAAGRPTPTGTYTWLLLRGTEVEITGEYDGQLRVRGAAGPDIWVSKRDVSRSAPVRRPRSAADSINVRPSVEGVDIRIPIGSPAPYQVREVESGLAFSLYSPDWEPPNRAGASFQDLLLSGIDWARRPGGELYLAIRLSGPLFGYDVVWEEGEMILRIRRPPPINATRPLRGLTIAVDPGHPPAGAIGPTGLQESEVTLAIARALAHILVGRGARVVLTRTDRKPVPLAERALIARRAASHAFLSVHVDAVPTGGDPDAFSGTTTYFYHGHAAPLARAVQWELARVLGLRDRGNRFGNFAVLRPTWTPSILTEAATLTIPEHEAALRDTRFRGRVAESIADGMEQYFRSLRSHSPSARR